MFPRYNSSSQGHASLSCSWRVGSVITDIWDVSHSPQKSPTHISGHTSLRTARRLSICALDSAKIFLGQSKRNWPVTVSAEEKTVTHRWRFSYSTSPKVIRTSIWCFSWISNWFAARKAGRQFPFSLYRDFTKWFIYEFVDGSAGNRGWSWTPLIPH